MAQAGRGVSQGDRSVARGVSERPTMRELLPGLREELARAAERGKDCPLLYILEIASGEYAIAMLSGHHEKVPEAPSSAPTPVHASVST